MFLAMGVTMRIYVRGQPSHQALELVNLTMKFVAHRGNIINIELSLVFTPHVPMNPNCQSWMIPTDRYGFLHGAPGHHHAGAGHHTAGVTFQDAAVYSRGRAEIVSIEDEILFHVSF